MLKNYAPPKEVLTQNKWIKHKKAGSKKMYFFKKKPLGYRAREVDISKKWLLRCLLKKGATSYVGLRCYVTKDVTYNILW